jgi:hypothetical protein
MLRSFAFFLTSISLAAFGLVAPAAAAPATAAAAAQDAKPSEAEAQAFLAAFSPPELRRAAELDILEKDFIPGLRLKPDTAAMLEAFPDLGPELQKALASQIDVFIAEYYEQFYPRAVPIVQQSLSKADIQTLTTFYLSPAGRKLLQLASKNMDGKEVAARAADDKPIDAGVATRQALRAGVRTFSELTEAERARVVALMGSPAGRHFRTLIPRMTALQVELMNGPSPKFEAAASKAMGEAFKRVTGVDFPNGK